MASFIKSIFGKSLDKAIQRLQLNDPNVTKLDLYNNGISAAQSGPLASALATNTTLLQLSLGRNNISDQGTEYLASALAVNSTLKDLDLSYNNLSDAGAAKLAVALAANSSLTRLNLEHNVIKNKGAKDLAKGLATNSTLTVLLLDRFYIDAAHMSELENLVKSTPQRMRAVEEARSANLKKIEDTNAQVHLSEPSSSSDALSSNPLSSNPHSSNPHSSNLLSSSNSLQFESLKTEFQEEKEARERAERQVDKLKAEATLKDALLSEFEIPPGVVQIKAPLSKKGGTGVVYSGLYHETEVAIKVLNFSDNLEDLKREVRTWCHFRHPHIITLIGFSTTASLPFIVMELMHADLYSHLHGPDFPRLSFPQRFRVADCVAAGLAYIHAQKAVHRDIKSLNILLRGVSVDQLLFDVKIADFGATRGQETMQKTFSDVKSLGYTAPELFDGAIATFASDVFAFSMVMYELLTKQLPFPTVTNMAQMTKILIVDKARPTFETLGNDIDNYRHMIQPWIALITKSWVDQADQRPSALEILHQLKEIARIPAPPPPSYDIDYVDLESISYTHSGEVFSQFT